MTRAGVDSWWTVNVVCLAVLMVVIDTTIVNVALPSIRNDLGFTEPGLVWVINAYLISFGSTLLLGGRLGDLYGQRRLFLAGLVLFAVASAACGLAMTPGALVVLRAVQGVGGAMSAAVALSLIVTLMPDGTARAKAMGLYSFVCAVGGSVGVLLGGVLTDLLSWRWIFLVNVPVGALVCALSWSLLPRMDKPARRVELDLWGAVTVTAALVICIYTIMNSEEAGWRSSQTLGLIAATGVSFGAFLVIEARAPHPLVPLHIFRVGSFTTANIVRVLWSAGGYTWFFTCALYLQLSLGYGPMEVGLAFLPANIVTALFAAGLSARIVTRYGSRAPLAGGLILVACGFLMFAFTSAESSAMSTVLPGMVLVGIGTGAAFSPLLLAAMSEVADRQSGLASGIINTAGILGGATGLAVLTSVSNARAQALLEAGTAPRVAFTDGYQLAFLLAAGCVAIAAGLTLRLSRVGSDR